MFSKFTSMLHQAVEALAPNAPVQQDFVGHWKAVTNYFIDNKEHRVSVEHTQLPSHLQSMLRVLVSEDKAVEEQGSTGPCMEYTLQHSILETLYTLARTDCPPGMKQQVLLFFAQLLSRVSQPLLPHIHVHRAVHRLVRVCGETRAAPSEAEEIMFLCVVCAKLRKDPYLVNFFIEVANADKPEGSLNNKTSFPVVDSLLNLMHSEDARVGVKSCEGLMLLVSLPEAVSSHTIVKHTQFCQEVTAQLCNLYNKLPKEMDPADVSCVEAKWGLDILSSAEDCHNFAGKRSLISFLSWLDYIDQLVQVAQPEVASALAQSVHTEFLTPLLQTALMQTSEAGAVTAMAHLMRCLRLIQSSLLVQEFVTFMLGDETGVEVSGETTNKLRGRLIERCNHLSEEMSMTALKLFETLLVKPAPHIIHNLVLRNLLGRDYTSDPICEPETPRSSQSQTDSQADSIESRTDDSGIVLPENGSIESSDSPTHNEISESSEKTAEDTHTAPSEEENESVAGQDEGSCESSPPESPGFANRGPTVHKVVNSFLSLVPEDAKSSYQMDDSGYDTYLRDAHRQYCDVSRQCLPWGWPAQPVCDPRYHSNPFYEGAFLHVLLDKMSSMFSQSYHVNLQVTAVIALLAHLPHPNLHEFLLQPLMTLQPGARTLTSVIHKLVHDIQSAMKTMPDFQAHLLSVRKVLRANNIRRSPSPDSQQGLGENPLLEGVIVLEEFCKELAAIAFVKHHAQPS